LFPDTEKLLTLERKYGDSLNYEDLNGKPGKARKKKEARDMNATQKSEATGTDFGGSSIMKDPNKT
jgi:hypothetical protein